MNILMWNLAQMSRTVLPTYGKKEFSVSKIPGSLNLKLTFRFDHSSSCRSTPNMLVASGASPGFGLAEKVVLGRGEKVVDENTPSLVDVEYLLKSQFLFNPFFWENKFFNGVWFKPHDIGATETNVGWCGWCGGARCLVFIRLISSFPLKRPNLQDVTNKFGHFERSKDLLGYHLWCVSNDSRNARYRQLTSVPRYR